MTDSQFLADTILAAALLAIALAMAVRLLWHPSQAVRADGSLRRLAALAVLALLFGGLANLSALLLPDGMSGYLKAGAAAATLVLAALLWLRTLGRPGADRTMAPDAAAQLFTQADLDAVRAELSGELDVQRQEIVEAERRFEIALRNSPISVFTQDLDLKFSWIHNPPAGIGPDVIGKADAEVFPAATAAQMLTAKQLAMKTGQPQELELQFDRDGRSISLYVLIEPLKDKEGTLSGTIGVAVDISQRKAQELQLRLLLRELTHRSKNLLAVVNAIARQTAARTRSIDDFLEAFNSRLVAIGCAHDVLIADDWKGASLRTLVEAQLSNHAWDRADRIEVEGGDVMLKPEAVQNVGLALHELFTNAQRWGALSTDEGKVDVHWSAPDGKGVTLVWEESGGPNVLRPEYVGFGRLMIESVVEKALDGSVDLTFDPHGVRCEILIPSAQLTPAT